MNSRQSAVSGQYSAVDSRPSPVGNRCRVVRIVLLLIACLTVRPASAQDTLSLRMVRYYVADHQVGSLCWNAVATATAYQLYRHFPQQEGYTLCGTLADTCYNDTIQRVVCGDTVGYYVTALCPDTSVMSDTVGLFYQDNLPTAPCSLRVATADTVQRRLLLTWYPSPDTDVMGYYICMGNPCRDFDTVWGRLNTSYLCPETLSVEREYSFRVLAFDSCFKASPLTPYYHNPVLQLTSERCSRDLQVRWNRYIHMPDSVCSYCLYYRLQGSDSLYRFCVGGDGPFAFDTTIAALTVGAVTAWLEVASCNDSLVAVTCPVTFHFEYGDTAAYLAIPHAEYDETEPSITLHLEVDGDFQGDEYYLLRSSEIDSHFRRIAVLPASDFLSGRGTYVDRDIVRTVARYIYRLDAPDICHQRSTSSDTLGVALPPVGEIAAYIPNAIHYGDPENGRFCPAFLSPLAEGYSLDIFSRMGLRVFHTERLGDCWDGTVGGDPLPQGVYTYFIRCKHADGNIKHYKGTILLLK